MSRSGTIIESIEDLDRFLASSDQKPLFLFKHSARCPISVTALEEYDAFLETAGEPGHAFLDILAHRDVSNEIASRTGVKHESPQALLFRGGSASWNASHSAIKRDALAAAVSEASASSGS